ncbi:dihydroorotate dehydrogenase electron transfer subunit [Candidatus Hakubella thermalkaliphila]|uniref:Dihydroorotate dehydrogenase B (NAD(+)), electron transfer subunit n=1 Tax=Candidatus Hakubella thermalkaliphila TaxID=2754717 RepID=A0A6V8P1U3_9ACTN|nr:dihydroorotate dehydrogenase electron transfer subunit [Candidatus Hakubella thermalkaliphila]GFP25624.1 dihydroorotate dehydrogenase electron transfer subunit [Candidatus Hakubella thermalkaliphila]GFP27631.1 dihydroorotate dehydrogenase electron transfer subunit [Candidatus Hakubella thermalkaliphila]
MVSQARLVSSTLIKKNWMTDEVVRLTFSDPHIPTLAVPGQFVFLRPSPLNYPLLRRPYSLFDVDEEKGVFDLLVKVVGVGSRILSQRSEREMVDLIGPLGNGFSLSDNSGQRELLTWSDSKHLIVAGGMGIAPMHFLARRLKERGEEVVVLFGAVSRNEVLCSSEFQELGALFVVSTEDGSLGKMGKVSSLIPEYLSRDKRIQIYACGPRGLLKEVVELSRREGLLCQVSMEERMACGLGACRSCVCKVGTESQFEYKRVCRDGPVFRGEELIVEKG